MFDYLKNAVNRLNDNKPLHRIETVELVEKGLAKFSDSKEELVLTSEGKKLLQAPVPVKI